MALTGCTTISLPRCHRESRLSSETSNESGHAAGHDSEALRGRRTYSGYYATTFAEDASDSEPELESPTISAVNDQVPPLTRGSSVISCESSTMLTEAAIALQNGFVLESDDGILTVPHSPDEPDADLLCPFQILDCYEMFGSVREYKLHVFAHFRGQPLPTFAICFLCEKRFEQTPEDDSALAWNNMLSHMAHEHFRRGQEEGTFRADFGLMRWMHDRKIISDHHFKRSQTCPTRIMLPTAISRRLSQSIASGTALPEAPSARSSSSQTSVISSISLSTRRLSSYGGQVYVTRAGARAERRRRESIRPLIRPSGVVS